MKRYKYRIYVCIKYLEKDKEFINKLKKISDDITIHPSYSRPTKKELCDIVKNYDIVICGVKEVFDEKIANCVKRLKIIATLSTGIDHIDVELFKRIGVKIVSLPHSNAISVAEHTWALILGLSKNLLEANQSCLQGKGRRGLSRRPIELYGKTIGIIGAGPVAYNVARIAKGFSMNILVWTLHPDKHKEFLKLGARFVNNLKDIFKNSDIITVNIKLSETTRNIITRDVIKEVTKPIILINTSREGIIELGAIAWGLKHGYILACGLDVFYEEEKAELLKYANRVILTPHIAGLSKEAIRRMRDDLVNELRKAIAGTVSKR